MKLSLGWGLRSRAGQALVGLGTIASSRQIDFLRRIDMPERTLDLLDVGRWFEDRGLQRTPCFRLARELYAYLATPLRNERVLYLEFGVYKGDSLRQWCTLLSDPQSSLHGFDSFRGLPENWDASIGMRSPKGAFDLGGIAPVFDDTRVTLHVGWFEETLPGFTLPSHDRLLVHLDADLYSSTKFVLDCLAPAICPGTILLFDELRVTGHHERRAFGEFLDATGMRFRFLAGSDCFNQSAFQRVG